MVAKDNPWTLASYKTRCVFSKASNVIPSLIDYRERASLKIVAARYLYVSSGNVFDNFIEGLGAGLNIHNIASNSSNPSAISTSSARSSAMISFGDRCSPASRNTSL